MIRQLLIHGFLLFALLFQSLAHAMPCCAMMDDLQADTTQSVMMEDLVKHAEEGCLAGSPACCAVPSLAYESVVLDSQSVTPVHAPTVTTLFLSQYQIPLDRPPRA